MLGLTKLRNFSPGLKAGVRSGLSLTAWQLQFAWISSRHALSVRFRLDSPGEKNHTCHQWDVHLSEAESSSRMQAVEEESVGWLHYAYEVWCTWVIKHPVCFEGSFLAHNHCCVVMNADITVGFSRGGHSGSWTLSLQTLGWCFCGVAGVRRADYSNLRWFWGLSAAFWCNWNLVYGFFFWLWVCKEWCPFTCCAARL